MAITEEDRFRLFRTLEAALGAEDANTLMSHLPPVGWADVATRQDLDTAVALIRAELHSELGELRTELRTEVARLDGRLSLVEGNLRAEIQSGLRSQFVQLSAMTAALLTLAVTVSELIR